MELSILEVLYIALIAFISVMWVLLSIVLIKLIKVLNVAVEITQYYYKIKSVFVTYSHIPEIVKEKVTNMVKWDKKKEKKSAK